MSAIFKGAQLDEILDGTCPKRFPASILTVARRKLAIVKAGAFLKT
jgi:hypothetical protein